MRIAILTLPFNTNYGGILQAYALQTILERQGHQVMVFDQPRPYLNQSKAKFLLKLGYRLANRYLMRKKKELLWERNTRLIRQYTDAFIDKYVHRYELKDFYMLEPLEFDALVVGSDQIWRRSYAKDAGIPFFSFAREWEGVKRVAYAPSFGLDEWCYSKEETDMCASLVKLFDYVTVREESGVELCAKYLGVRAEQVLDPTMLLHPADYKALVHNRGITSSEGDLMVYLLGNTPDNSRFVQEFASKFSLHPFKVYGVKDVAAPLRERIQPPVEQWIRGFMDARFVITDSFHACVFSILFHVPFVVLSNKTNGLTRIYSLLKMFDMEGRFVNTVDEAAALGEIDWKVVDEKLGAWREGSMYWIEKLSK